MIYLAAGASRRFGADKLLTEYEGNPLFCTGCRRWLRCVKHVRMLR